MSRPAAPLVDAGERARIREDLATTLVVEAAAGTGKTTALVGRMVAAIASGRAALDRIVAVTFTELAAGELKLRLRAELERARRDPTADAAARACLTAALPQLEEARIGTIHSFCADVLRERPVEAGVDPLFEVAPEDVAGDLFRRAFDRWFERQLEQPDPAVRRVLRRPSRDGRGPREILRSAAWELASWRDFPAPWRADPFDRDRAIDAVMAALAALDPAPSGRSDDYLDKSIAEIGRFVAEVERREQVRSADATGAGVPGRDYDGLEAELMELDRAKHWRWIGFSRGPDAAARAARRAARDTAKARLAAFVEAAGADLAPRLREELRPVVAQYERLKASAGRLDFLDLLLRARDLLRDDAAVRRALQERFTHVFVDEFQDTDPLQAEILLLLAADDPAVRDWTQVRVAPGKLFVVGDPKQSIYRFRRADVGLYETVKRQLVAGGAEILHLVASFRAVPDVQEAVNAALGPRMAAAAPAGPGGPVAPAYVPLAPVRAAAPGQPAVVALPVPAPYGDFGKVVYWRIEESLPDAVAAFVDWLVRASGWTVSERERPHERVPIDARHVCLLFRRFRTWDGDVTRPYVRALEARHLPHVLVGGSAFHAREEVEAVRNALLAIERPDDDLAVFATLRGPFFALGDGALLALRERFRSLHPFRKLPDDLPAGLAEVAAALAVLRDLHRQRNRRSIAETITRLLGATRAHAGLAIWPTGEQALANVARLVDLARRAERQGCTSFRAFVERLLDDAERGEAGDAPILEEGTGGVRLMTVHRAKGLEFPVVILADPTAREARGEPDRWLDPVRGVCALRLAGCAPPELLEHRDHEMARDREEAVRLLYVAATRARDVLIVPTVGDERMAGWTEALGPALHPPEERRRQPAPSPPDGCPTFGADSVRERPPRAPGRERAVAPGLHRPEAGAHGVVWWDPAVLTLGVEESVGLRQQKLLEADEGGAVSEQGIVAHAAWQEERARVGAAAAAPSLRVVTATEHAAAHPPEEGSAAEPDEVEVLVAEVALEPAARLRRPHGTRFGTLVHAVLAAVPLDGDASAVRAAALQEARILGAPADEQAAAAEAVAATLADPWLRRAAAAAAAGRCRRETAVALVLDDGTLVEGVVDLAFHDPGAAGWTVLDFKTDRELGGRLAEYRRQVGLYARAIARATGVPAGAVLLRV